MYDTSSCWKELVEIEESEHAADVQGHNAEEKNMQRMRHRPRLAVTGAPALPQQCLRHAVG